ncbi:hypothetical protein Aspvir_007440 [Aspergillus viridinutans]|uniref:Velvet domain-containing protein n=1 Tax=Aspergillus viridinutans TaxID=75553 RepID=A0A9P3F6U6_ASPVI|nr:uncharacterized protein Aspvir_007440 [Aspergillus viridinutans]GIK03371.1 hypothetical protein Aspvir_007440 [Aspergillus viridinutans]
MSDTPFQQWNYSTSVSRYLNSKSSASFSERGEVTPDPASSYSKHEPPPPFIFQGTQGYDPPVVSTAIDSRFSSSVHPWVGGAEQRYNDASASAGSLSQIKVLRSGQQRRADQWDSIAPASADSIGQMKMRWSGPPTDGDYSQFPHHGVSNHSHGQISVSPSEHTRDVDSCNSTRIPSPVRSDRSSAALNGSLNLSQALPPQPPRQVSSGIPMGFDRLLNHSPGPSPPPRRVSASPRYHLHIRQQPIAARACGAGDRDRRPVDPPPIIQMLLTDFDPQSQADLDILQDPRLTVGCLLLPVSAANSWPGSPETDGSCANREDRTASQRTEENAPGPGTPLLSGKAFVSPFHVDLDPDPQTAPPHPTSADHKVERKPGAVNSTNGLDLAKMRVPATFFVFPDLSIRSAGVYRLQFRLMNWGLVEDTGQSMPVLAEVWSDPFRVYPAKDFPGMRDSSPLTEALKELGFVELKTRGKGKGKGRRR